jgi:O-antigen/teichoic acid export membrane protein
MTDRPIASPEPSPVQVDGTEVRNASGALGWSFLNTVVAKLGTLVTGVVLARTLGPAEFGSFAIAMVALIAVLSFNELGVSLAIVRWPGDPRTIAPTVNTISVATSFLLLVAVYGLAAPFAGAMGDPSATPLVRLLALAMLIDGVVAVPAAMLQRSLRQDRKFAADQVNTWVGAATSLLLALSGAGAISLVVGRLVGSLLAAVIILRGSPVPYRLGWSRSQSRALLGYGLPLALASVVVFAVGFVDQVAIGTSLGPVALGYYVLAVNLASWPVFLFSQPLRSVAPAVFARLQNDPGRTGQAYGQFVRPVSALAVPSCLALAASAEPVVRIVYGDQWAPAAAALRWLALLAVLRILFELSYDVLVVTSSSHKVFTTQLAWLCTLAPAVLLATGSGFGIAGVSIAQVLVGGVVVLPLYLFHLHRHGVRPLLQLQGALPVLAVSVLAVVTAYLLAPVTLSDWGFVLVVAAVTAPVAVLFLLRARPDIMAWRGMRAEALR